jgi:hypothetical protein
MPQHRAMIDIPIGLKSSGHRACDIRVREPVGASVFLGARARIRATRWLAKMVWTAPDGIIVPDW